MPKIPQIASRPVRLGARATALDFGGGRGLRAVGNALNVTSISAAAYFDAGQRANVSRGLAGSAQKLDELSLEYDARMAATSDADDPTTAIAELKQEYLTRQQEVLNEFRGTIKGTRYQQLFDARSAPLQRGFTRQVNELARARELANIEAGTLKTVTDLTDLAIRTKDPELRDVFLEQIDEVLRDGVAAGGLTPRQLVEAQIRVDEKVRQADLRNESQTIADELMDGIDDPRERLRVAREKYPGELRDHVVARVKDRNAEEKALADAQADALFDNAVARAQAHDLTRAEALDLGLPGGRLNTVMSIIDHGPVTRDWPLFYKLEQEGSNPGTRDQFLARNLNDFAGVLSRKEIGTLRELQQRPDEDALDSYPAKVNRALATLKLPITPEDIAKEDDKDKVARSTQFRRQIDAEKRRREAEKGRRLTSPELNELVDFGLQEVATDEEVFFRDQDVLARFTLTREDIDDVPQEFVHRIADSLEGAGLDPTDTELIRRQYFDMVQRGDLP